MIILDHSPIHSDPELMGGTRVPAQAPLDDLDDGFSLEEFLEVFPSVEFNDAKQFLRLSRDV